VPEKIRKKSEKLDFREMTKKSKSPVFSKSCCDFQLLRIKRYFYIISDHLIWLTAQFHDRDR
jgi:hypothetical protein